MPEDVARGGDILPPARPTPGAGTRNPEPGTRTSHMLGGQMGMPVTRRGFLRVSGACVFGASLNAQADRLESRAHEVLRDYDAQGEHRTGTVVDRASGEWLREQVTRAGGAVRVLPFALDRVDVRAAFLEVDGRRFDGLPFFDGGVTTSDGVAAPAGPTGIRVVTADAAAVATEGEFLAEERRAGRVRAIVVLTQGGVPGLIPSNARHFTEPYGCPVLQVPSSARAPLDAAAAAGRPIRVVCDTARTRADSFNVIADCPGRDPSLAPVVVITPRSGWWTCASERGGGLACWLEAIRAAADARPARRVLAVASSGHELGHLGLEAFLHADADLLGRAHAWVHLGANIGAGAPGTRVTGVRLQSSDESLADRAGAALDVAGAPIADRLPPGQIPRGEARNLHVGGARYLSLLGQGNRWFHHQDDRYPATVSAAVVARYAQAVAAFVVDLARAPRRD